MKIYRRFFKRLLDILLALAVIILLSPIFIIVAILVRINLGSPILFKQQRPGMNEQIFMLYKFRTMTNKRDENGELLPRVQECAQPAQDRCPATTYGSGPDSPRWSHQQPHASEAA